MAQLPMRLAAVDWHPQHLLQACECRQKPGLSAMPGYASLAQQMQLWVHLLHGRVHAQACAPAAAPCSNHCPLQQVGS